jgi:uncharacterized protein YecT (DUF1311 family)
MNGCLEKTFALGFVFALGSGPVLALDCTKAAASEEVARCLGDELREADVHINDSYSALMTALPAPEKTDLRIAQRAWLKERNLVCGLSSKETDREKWYRAVLLDYRKTVCVTRYTRQRTAELDRMSAEAAAKAAPASPPVEVYRAPPNSPPAPTASPPPVKAVMDGGDYQRFANGAPERGRWYFEVAVDGGGIASFSPTALWVGCLENKTKSTYGSLGQIRATDTAYQPARVGVALDLESGHVYMRRNGTWLDGPPGSSGGMPAKLGRPYRCGIESTAPVGPMIERGLVRINYGDAVFMYAIPDGYQPLADAGR